MPFDTPFQLVHALSGNTIKVLMVLLFARQQAMGALGEQRIQAIAGLSQNTARKCLAELEIYELAVRNGDFWALPDGAAQLPLFDLLEAAAGKSQILTLEATPAGEPSQNLTRAAEEGAPIEGSEGALSTDSADLSTSEGENATKTTPAESKFDSSGPSSSGSRYLDSRVKDLPPATRAGDESKNDSRRALEAELDALGIRNPARAQLLSLEHVTADLVRYHGETAKTTGQAIWRIAHNWRIDPHWMSDHAGQQDKFPASETTAGESPAPPALAEWAQEAWRCALQSLEDELPPVQYQTWVACAQPIAADPRGWVVRTANKIAAEEFRELALERLEAILGAPVTVEG